jgi:DNA-binding CsgD family transcriptional regulator
MSEMKKLTRQEQKIAALVARGLTNKEIAQWLGSSPLRVQNQVQVIIRKLELKTRAQVTYLIGRYANIIEDLDQYLRYPKADVGHYDIIQSQSASAVKDRDTLPSQPTDPQPQGDPSARQGTNTPDLGLEQTSRRERTRKPASREREEKRQGVVYERELAPYKREYLQESAEPLSALLVDTIKNNDDPLSPVAEEALRLFTKAALKAKAITLNKASQELDISVASLSDFVRKGLVPTLYRNKGAIYLAKSTAEELGRDLEDAREMGMQPARLLRERREKYFPKAKK